MDLKSLEAYVKQVANSGSVEKNSEKGYSTNPSGKNYGADTKVSLWEKDEQEEKKVSNAYDEYFEELMFEKEEDSAVEDSDYQKTLDKKYNNNEEKETAAETFKYLTDAGILNEQYYERMICATEKLVQNNEWLISIADADGNISDVALADAVAASFDSELDLYIQDIVSEVMAEYGTCSKGYLSDGARAELAAKGIRVDSVGQGTEEDGSNTNRVYSFSLVELPAGFENLSPAEQMEIVYAEDAKIVEDKAGNKGSYLFADALIPDGFAQNAEINMSSILDTMGFDCISKADFIGADDKFNEEEYKAMLAEVGSLVNSGTLKGDNTIDEIYGNTKEISASIRGLWGGDGAAPGQYGIGGGVSSALQALQEKNRLENETDKKRAELLEEKISEFERQNGREPEGEEYIELSKEVDRELKLDSAYTS